MGKRECGSADTAAFCRALWLLNRAGVSDADGLHLLAADAPEGSFRARLSEMARDADAGLPLSEVVRRSGAFPAFLSAMLAVGERSGRTEETLAALADGYEERERREAQLRSAVFAPALLLTVLLGVLGVLLAYVLPVFGEVYAQLGTELSGLAGLLLRFGEALRGKMPLCCVLLGLMPAFFALFGLSERFRRAVLRRFGALPGDRGVARKAANAAFLRALSLAVGSGMAADAAAKLASALPGSPGAQTRAAEALRLLTSGAALAEALTRTGFLSASEGRILAAAERAGAPERGLRHAAEAAGAQYGEAIEALLGRIEPAAVLLGAALTGLVLWSVMLPLLHILSAIG